MQAVKEIGRVESVLRHLPSEVRAEIVRRASARIGGTSSIREIRLRLGVSSVLFSREWVGLVTRCEREELSDTLTSLTGGAVYAERDSMARGYISTVKQFNCLGTGLNGYYLQSSPVGFTHSGFQSK